MSGLSLALTSAAENEWLAQLLAKEPDDIAVLALRVVLIIVLGLGFGRLLGTIAGRIAGRRGSAQSQMLTSRFVFYGVLAIAGFMILDTLGVDASVLLGAAGVLTVAIGFASQTSASNLISGLFLLGERPFSVGDLIEVGTRTGIVLSVDLLSVKLRTFENLFVRVPNETLIKSDIVNLSRNPIRRIEVKLRLAYDEDFQRVAALLQTLAQNDPDILEEPEPVCWIDQLGDSAVHVRFLVWASNRASFFDVRSRIHEAIVKTLREQQVAVGYPQVGLDDKRSPKASAPLD